MPTWAVSWTLVRSIVLMAPVGHVVVQTRKNFGHYVLYLQLASTLPRVIIDCRGIYHNDTQYRISVPFDPPCYITSTTDLNLDPGQSDDLVIPRYTESRPEVGVVGSQLLNISPSYNFFIKLQKGCQLTILQPPPRTNHL